MAYIANNLAQQFAGGGGLAKRFVYTTADTLTTVQASGYFNSAANLLKIGDLIQVVVVDIVDPSTRTSVTGSTDLLVATNDGTTVTTTVPGPSAGAVNTTATTLTITKALHGGRIVTINSAAPIAITLPAATGTGARYSFFVGTVATATSHTIKVANTVDVMSGVVLALTTSSANAIGYGTTATSDTISLNGTTLGGVVGDRIEIIDVAAGIFSVQGVTSPTGSTATPFSATV